MRILILGAGALGGYFGARLLAAGRDVTFLVRPARAALLAEKGLNVYSPHGGDLHFPAPPTVTSAAGPYDLILISAKAYDLASAMDSIAPAVGPDTAILPLLNGMAHIAELEARFGAEKVLGGTCLISATLAPDGSIHHLNKLDNLFWGNRGSLRHPQMQQITAALSNAGYMGVERPNIVQDMWEKWTFLAAFAAVTCLMRANIGEIVAAGGAPVALALSNECGAIAAAEGHPPADAYVQAHQAVLTTPGSSMEASLMRDLEAGARIESQQILGDLLDRAHRHNVAAPTLEIAFINLKSYEARLKRPAK